jgi:hypothetical protein
MTLRKPFGTGFVPWVEAQISEAMDAGAFDTLPGAGKPLPNNKGQFDPDWWVKQYAEREGVSILPASLALLRKVEKELALIRKLGDEAAVRRRVAAVNAEIVKLNMTLVDGPPTTLSPLDVDQVVAEWRESRSTKPR